MFAKCFGVLVALVSFFCTQVGLLALEENGLQPYVLVSVAPYKNFVEKIAKDAINVILMVPAGASSHTFEPTPQQMLRASKADIWFQIGESFEPRATQALKSYNPKMEVVDLRKNVDLIMDTGEGSHCCHCHHHSCIDPHFWLSPTQCKIQAHTITEALMARYPAHADAFKRNLETLLQELDALNTEIQATLAPLKNRMILVSHPAYAYFCRDYHLKQLSIEFEGKDPSPKQLTQVLRDARESKVKVIFTQPQYSSKGASLIAKEIGAKLVSLDPYAEDYFGTMRNIATQFALQ